MQCAVALLRDTKLKLECGCEAEEEERERRETCLELGKDMDARVEKEREESDQVRRTDGKEGKRVGGET